MAKSTTTASLVLALLVMATLNGSSEGAGRGQLGKDDPIYKAEGFGYGGYWLFCYWNHPWVCLVKPWVCPDWCPKDTKPTPAPGAPGYGGGNPKPDQSLAKVPTNP